MVSTCPCCSRERNSFVCRSCLTKLLKLYKTQASSHNSLLPAAQARASNGIKIAEQNRVQEAKHWTVKTDTNIVQDRITALSKDMDAAQHQIQQRRSAMEERRRRLGKAKAALQSNATTTTECSELRDLQEHLNEVASQLTGTRQILLRELLDAMDVIESTAPGCSFQIGSLPVPPLLKLQTLSKQQVNATLSLLVLLVKLLSAYLGIQLPFVLSGTATKPLIRALTGTTNAMRFPKAYPLYMSSGAGYSTTSTSTSSKAPSSSSQTPTPASHAQALSIGIKMLGYNVFYLHAMSSKHSDDLKTTLASGTSTNTNVHAHCDDILALIVDMSIMNTTGRLSHVLTKQEDTLRPVESASEETDFSKYLQMLEERSRIAEGDNAAQLSSINTKKKGKYVVVPNKVASKVSEEEMAGSHPASSQDEGWDLL